jgi:hypothetical protein
MVLGICLAVSVDVLLQAVSAKPRPRIEQVMSDFLNDIAISEVDLSSLLTRPVFNSVAC